MNEEIKNLLEYLYFNVYETTNWVMPLALDDKTWKLLLNYITNLQEENQKLKKDYATIVNNNCDYLVLEKENQKLNKIIDELEKWLKETKKFNCGFKIKSEYIYTYEFVCKNILNKLTKLKNEVE